MNSIQNYGYSSNYSRRVNNNPNFKAFITTEQGVKILDEMRSMISRKAINYTDEIMQTKAITLATQLERIAPTVANSKFYDLVFNKAGLCIKRCCEDVSKAISRNTPFEASGNKIINHADNKVLGVVKDEPTAKRLVANLAPLDNTEAFIDMYKALEENAQINADRAEKTLSWYINNGKV